jgi:hypothetical protein
MITPERLARSGTEESHQVALMAFCALEQKRYPELQLLFHIANGEQRSRITGARLKAAGVKAGVPDLLLPVGKRGFHSLYIEMKTEIGIISNKQKYWIEKLTEQGNYVKVCRSWEEARDLLIWYLEG